MKCKNCNKNIDKWRKFCSLSCTALYTLNLLRKQKRKIKIKKTCEKCKKKFIVNYYERHRKCCSIKCAKGHFVKRKTKKVKCFKCGKTTIVKRTSRLKQLCKTCKKHNKIYKKCRIIKKHNKICKVYKIYKEHNKNCKICKQKFKTYDIEQKCCSRKCGNKLSGIMQKGVAKPSGKFRKKGSGGFREKGGKTKKYYRYKKQTMNFFEYELAKIFDKLKLKWNRNTKIFFEYLDQQKKKRKFYPDFYLKKIDCYVEYKGWINEKILHKMKDAQNRNKFKLLIIYSNDKRYKNLGLNLETVKNDNNSLLRALSSLK